MDSLRIKIGTLADSPTLLTASGRFPSGPTAEPQGYDTLSANGLYQQSRWSQQRESLNQAEQSRVVSEVESKIAGLLYRIDNLHLPESDLLARENLAVSSQPYAVADESADRYATEPQMASVQVYWTAQPGLVNSSKENPVEEAALAAGDYSMQLVVEGEAEEFTVSVSSGDTHQDLLERLARAISAQDSRISAQVVKGEQPSYLELPRAGETDPKELYVRLAVTSTGSGSGADFYLTDTDGDLLTTYGLNTGYPARLASLRFSGASRQQSSNLISLDGGHLSATAAGQTDDAARLAVSKAYQVVSEELNGLISAYNDLVSTLDANYDLLRPSLKDRVTRPLEGLANQLSRAGLSATAGGRISRKSEFNDLLKSNFGQVREVLLSEDGWVSGLAEKLGQIHDLGVAEFASDLVRTDTLSDRRRAWALVESLTGSIVSRYL